MPVIGLKNDILSKTLNVVPAKGCPITTEWNLIWLKNKKFSHISTAYLDFIKAEKQRIMNVKFSWFDKYIKNL
jgi:hypothetical protein